MANWEKKETSTTLGRSTSINSEQHQSVRKCKVGLSTIVKIQTDFIFPDKGDTEKKVQGGMLKKGTMYKALIFPDRVVY